MDFAIALLHGTVDLFVEFLSPISPYLIKTYSIQARTIAMLIASIMLMTALSQILFAMVLPRIKTMVLALWNCCFCSTSYFAIFSKNEHCWIVRYFLRFFWPMLPTILWYSFGQSQSKLQNGYLLLCREALSEGFRSNFLLWVGSVGLNKIIFLIF